MQPMPHPGEVNEIMRFLIAPVEPRKYADDFHGALCTHYRVRRAKNIVIEHRKCIEVATDQPI